MHNFNGRRCHPGNGQKDREMLGSVFASVLVRYPEAGPLRRDLGGLVLLSRGARGLVTEPSSHPDSL